VQCAVPRPAFAVKHALALRRPVRLLKWKRGARALTQVTDVKRIALNTTGALRQARVRTPFNSSLVSLPRTCSAAKLGGGCWHWIAVAGHVCANACVCAGVCAGAPATELEQPPLAFRGLMARSRP